MSFETEPLQLVPMQWSKVGDRTGLYVRDGRFLPVGESTPSAAPDLGEGELGTTLEALLRLYYTQATPQTLQSLILGLRQVAHVPRLRGVHRAIEFLYDHGLIMNASATHWIAALRQDAAWRRSFLDSPLFTGPLFRLSAGRALREFFVALTAIAAIAGVIGSVKLLSLCWHTNLPETTNIGFWTIQALISLTLARSIRSVVQAILLRGLSGQGQSLLLRLTPTGVHVATDSIAAIENRKVCEGLAALASILMMSLACLVKIGDLQLIAALFTAVAMLIELSPLAQSPLLETLRYFYSRPQSSLSESELAKWHTGLSFLWMLLAAGLALKMGLRFRQPLVLALVDARGSHDVAVWLGLAVFAWGLVSIFVSWIEDAVGAQIFGDAESFDQTRTLRSLFRLRVVRSEDRPLRTAEDIAQERSAWQKASFLRALDEPTRKMFLKGASLRTFPKGTLLCKKGSPERELFIILSGEAEVLKRTRARGTRVVAMLTEGSAFGEVGYFLGEARTADVRAVKETVALCLVPSPELQAMATERFGDLQKRIWFLQALQRNPIFKNIPAEALDSLIFQGVFKRYPPKAAIVREGDAANSCTFIVQGEARVFKGGREINAVHQGDIVGEIALLYQTSRSGPSVRTASVFAESDVLAVEFSADVFWSAISAQVPLGLAFEEQATRRLSHDMIRKEVNHFKN